MLSSHPPSPQLCAVINNNVRCYDESLEFAEGLEELLADSLKGECGSLALATGGGQHLSR